MPSLASSLVHTDKRDCVESAATQYPVQLLAQEPLPCLLPQLSVYPMDSQVKSVNLSEGELLSIRGVDGPTLTVLANQTLLVEGQVIRSPTNTISVYFRTFQDDGLGTFQLHYQGRVCGGQPNGDGLPSLQHPVTLLGPHWHSD